MTSKISKIPQDLHYKKLAKHFMRIERQHHELADASANDESIDFGLGTDKFYGATKDEPFEGSVLLHEMNLHEDMPFFNSLLLYRILKFSYEDPDVLGAYIDTKSKSASPLDWGYLLQVSNELSVEIRTSKINTRQLLRFWYNTPLIDVDKKKEVGGKMTSFLKELATSLEKNAHFFNEKEEINNQTFTAISNIFARRYKSAEELLTLAQLLNNSADQEKKDLDFGEEPSVTTRGSLYLSAAIFFIIALESLVNIIFHCLLKKDFCIESYERITKRGDLDIRLASAHLFCCGFSKTILKPGTDLWGRFLKIRDFRNDIIHGNVTENHHIYSFQEDGKLFFYSPNTDFRGRKTEEKAKKKYPTSMTQIRKKHVMEIKESVDLIIQSINESADENTTAWIDSWLWQIMILPYDNSAWETKIG